MNPYIQSLRLRTLPLSVSGIILGSGLAYDGEWGIHHWRIVAIALCTTLCLQIVSNLANELGDALKGTDSDQHGREAYGLQSGTITVQQMKGMIQAFVALSIGFGLDLIYNAFGTFLCLQSGVFIGLGALALIGAVTYTLGKHSYGYMGLGDLGVFLFFGLLSTIGAYYLLTQTVTAEAVWCGAAIGLPCVGVLNLNNIRDMNNDIVHGKHTFAARLGQTGARIYQTLLLASCLTLFACFGHLWSLCVLPIWIWHLSYVWSHHDKLDHQMPILMFSTLIVAILCIF
jgi:1,4-dihydroxy-2-naphthoate octaprenyltransferase